jgi:hypothetical protein
VTAPDNPAPGADRRPTVVSFLTAPSDPQQQGAMVANVGWLLAVAAADVLVIDWQPEEPAVTRHLQLCPAQQVDTPGLGAKVAQAQSEAFSKALPSDPGSAPPQWSRYQMAELPGRLDVATLRERTPTTAQIERFCTGLAAGSPYHFILLNGPSGAPGGSTGPAVGRAVAALVAQTVVVRIDDQPNVVPDAKILVKEVLERPGRDVVAIAANWADTRVQRPGALLRRQLVDEDEGSSGRIKISEIEDDRYAARGRTLAVLLNEEQKLTDAYRHICALVSGSDGEGLADEPTPQARERYEWALGRSQSPRPFGIAYLPPDRLQADQVARWLHDAGARIRALPLVDGEPGSGRLQPRRGDETLVIGSRNLRPGDRRLPDGAIWVLDDATDRSGEPGAVPVIDLFSIREDQRKAALLAGLGMFIDTRPASGKQTAAREAPPNLQPPVSDPRFVGRDWLLEELRNCFAPMAGTNLRPKAQPVVLVGEPGIGKSGVAIEYAHRFGKDYAGVLWVAARDRKSVRAALAEFGLDQGREMTDDLAADALQYLREMDWASRWLLVFDNVADDALDGIDLDRVGDVIITAESIDSVRLAGQHVIELQPLAMHESWQFLRQPAVGVPGLTDPEATTVTTQITGMPVPLTVAAACLSEKVRALEGQFIRADDARRQAVDDLIDRLAANQPGTDVPTRVLAVACEQLGDTDIGRLTVTLAEMCAFLSPDGINLDLVLRSGAFITQLAEQAGRAGQLLLRDESDIDRVLAAGARFGLYDLDWGRQGLLRMHRVLQRGMVALLDRSGERKRRQAGVLTALAALAPIRADSPGSAEVWEELRRHAAESGALNVDELGPELAGLETPGQPGWAVRRWLVEQIAFIRRNGQSADQEKALGRAERLIARWEGYGPDDPLRLRLVDQQAGLLLALGRDAQAFEIDQAVLANFRRSLGVGHPRSLHSTGGWAADLRHIGQFEEACFQQRIVAEQLKEALGEDHPRTLAEGNNLAVSLFLAGLHGDALALQRDQHERRARILGADDTWFQRSLRDLGIYLSACGHHTEALTHLEESRRLLGPRSSPNDKLEDLRVAKALAVARRRAGGQSAQELVYAGERLLADHRSRLGPDHAYTLAAQLSYAVDLHLGGQAHEAVTTASDCRHRLVRRYGGEHPFVGIARANTAVFLFAANQVGPAMRDAEEAIGELTAGVEEHHPWVLAATVNLARIEAADGNRTQAFSMLKNTRQICLTDLGAWHPITVAATANLDAAGNTEGIQEAAMGTGWTDIDIDIPLV